jgi:TRAP-type uncharacterized transport system substrate-binding protein
VGGAFGSGGPIEQGEIERMRHLFRAFAIVLALATVAIGVVFVVNRPKLLRVAIVNSDGYDQRLFGVAADALRTTRAPIRLQTVTVADAAAATAAVDQREVELAVVRSDAIVRGTLQTALILREEAAVLVAPKTGKVQKPADVAGATLGVVREGPTAPGLLQPVLDFYGLAAGSLKTVPLRPGEIAQALQQRKVDALVMVGPPSSKFVADAIAEAARSARGGLQFIDVTEADAIAKRAPALASIEIEAGTFGGRPPRPAESVTTIGYSIRVVAHPKADNDLIAEFARQMLTLRQSLNQIVPGADLIKTPDIEEISALLVHPGARLYVNGEQKSFLEKYSDYIYLGLFVGSGVGTLVAGFLSGSSQRRRRDAMDNVARIEAALDSLRVPGTAEELDALEQEIDEVFRRALKQVSDGDMDATGVAAFELAVAEVRRRIAAARAKLLAGQASPPPALQVARPEALAR